MRLFRIVAHRFRSVFFGRAADAGLDREIAVHMEQLAKELMAAGMSEFEAREAARREFGPVEVVKEECRDMRGVNLIRDLFKDLAYTRRTLMKSPGFTLTAVLSLALGTGANTIVFSVVNALILKPLPVRDPGRIYFMNNSGQPANSFPNYRDIRDRNAVFESLFGYRITQMSLDGHGAANRVWGYLVTGNYFETLGIQPAVGRFFTPAEDVQPRSSPYAVLSYSCWKNRFAGDSAIAGKEIRLNGHPYMVLGVAPRGFHGTEVFYWAEIWVPMMMQPQIETYNWLETRTTFNIWIAGRLKPGVSVEQAEANLRPVAAQLAREHSVNEGVLLTLSAPGLAGSVGRDPTRAFAGGVMLLAALVLFAACANLAVLLTARAADRERELAIRVSIGAGRGRLIRQLLAESLALSLAGGVGGCSLAIVLLRALSLWRAPLDFPVQFDVNPDWRVYLFSFVAALVTGILFSLGPALRAAKADPAMSLKGLAAPVSGRRWAARDLLLPVQIALCSVLVTASVVAMRGLMRSLDTPLGFQPDGVAVVGYDAGIGGYDVDHGRVFEQRVLDEVSRLPGVECAAYSSSVPLSIDDSTTTVFRENTTDLRPRNSFGVPFYDVSPGYFRAAGTHLLAGRDFTPQDDRHSPLVAIVNQTFARRIIGTTDALGRRFRQRRDDLIEVVGVVEDGKYETLTETPKPVLFMPISQAYSPTIVLMVRSHRPETEMAAEMRQVIARLDPHLAVYGVGSLRQMLGFAYLPAHAAAITLGAFGVLAVMLSVTGIYGLAAYTVARRSREIGIRMAIGARSRQVLRFVFGRIGSLVAAGAMIGIALGVAGAGILVRIVYQASSRDPLVIGAASLSIALVAIVAAVGPALHAIGIDPVQSLRHE